MSYGNQQNSAKPLFYLGFLTNKPAIWTHYLDKPVRNVPYKKRTLLKPLFYCFYYFVKNGPS